MIGLKDTSASQVVQAISRTFINIFLYSFLKNALIIYNLDMKDENVLRGVLMALYG